MSTSKLLWKSLSLISFILAPLPAAGSYYVGTEPCCCPEHITAPVFGGGYDIGGGWLYLQPTSTDGDLQYGTLLTLTADPGELTAHLLELTPDYRNAYRGNIGYYFPCTNWNVDLNYLYFDSKEKQNIGGLTTQPFQFTQNLLGGSFLTANANEKQRIDQIDLTVGNHFNVDGCFRINPFVGVSYGRIKRDFDVGYTKLIDIETRELIDSSELTGKLESCYWGVGPVAGFNFSYPLFCSLSFEGHFGGGVYFGNIDSETSANINIEETYRSFDSSSCYHRAVPFFNTGLQLSYTYARPGDCIGFKLSVGYLVDYYFKAVDRTVPLNGFVYVDDPKHIKTSSNLGLGGPYVYLSLIDNPVCRESKLITDYVSTSCHPPCGFFGGMTNSWLVASPSNKDLDYALVYVNGEEDKWLSATPSHNWAGSYYLGYRLPCNLDFRARYFHYSSTASTSTTAKDNQEIKSVNASGPTDVRYGNVSSKIGYEINQFDIIAGKYIQPCRELNIYTYVGMRYADLDRTQNNGYFDGVPPLTSTTKTNRQKSMMSGIGPIFGLDPEYTLCNKNFGLAAHLNLALLVGSVKSKLNQKNIGSIGEGETETFNNLSIRGTQWIIPVVDLKAGLFYTCSWKNCLSFKIELGYQFSEYYRSINRVFPVLLTGLGQTNSDLRLQGPYIAIDIFGY